MKISIAMLFLLMTIVMRSMACEERMWRGHKVLCCNNGSAVMAAEGEWIWVKERPPICGAGLYRNVSKAASKATIVIIILGTIACVACHLYYLAACIIYQVVRRMW